MRAWSIRITMLDERGEEIPASLFEKATYKLHPSFEKPQQSMYLFYFVYKCFSGWFGSRVEDSRSSRLMDGNVSCLDLFHFVVTVAIRGMRVRRDKFLLPFLVSYSSMNEDGCFQVSSFSSLLFIFVLFSSPSRLC